MLFGSYPVAMDYTPPMYHIILDENRINNGGDAAKIIKNILGLYELMEELFVLYLRDKHRQPGHSMSRADPYTKQLLWLYLDKSPSMNMGWK